MIVYGSLETIFCPVCKKDTVHTFGNTTDDWDSWICTTCERSIKVEYQGND